jgi:hypothetical protein
MQLKSRLRVVVSSLAIGVFIVTTAITAAAQEVRWKTIDGILQTGDLVGVGTGQVTGAAPWVTTGGSAYVNLDSDQVNFYVRGLVLAVGSVPSQGIFGAPIGTPGPVTQVKGTLVCNVDGSANGGNSVDIDTPPTTLDSQGNAHFSGSFTSSLPTVCSSETNDAFLIRIVLPTSFANAWIAFGAVPTSY